MLTDLIATRGEVAAARITKRFRYSGDAHRELYEAIRDEIDKAYRQGKELGRDDGYDNGLRRCGWR